MTLGSHGSLQTQANTRLVTALSRPTSLPLMPPLPQQASQPGSSTPPLQVSAAHQTRHKQQQRQYNSTAQYDVVRMSARRISRTNHHETNNTTSISTTGYSSIIVLFIVGYTGTAGYKENTPLSARRALSTQPTARQPVNFAARVPFLFTSQFGPPL